MSRLSLAAMIVLACVTAGAWAQSPTVLQAYANYPLGSGAQAQTVAVGDLNGDARDDVAITAWWPSAVYVFHQQADGTLGAPVALPAPNMPLGIAAGDLNGDGRADLAVGGTDGALLLFYQQSDGTLASPTYCFAAGWTNGIAIADFNADGLADLATSCNFPGVLLMEQQAGGSFGFSFLRYNGTNGRCISALDYNSDGKTDIGLLTDTEICVMTQGSFGTPQYLPVQWAHSLAAGDVTGDGRDDLIYTQDMNRPDALVGVYAPGEGGLASALATYPVYDRPQPPAIADFDGDGRNDVVMAHGGYEALTLLRQSSEGALVPWESYPAPYVNEYEHGSIAVGDLNSDGLKDVAVADWSNGLTVYLHTNDKPKDTTAPVVSAQLAGTPGMDDWYVSPVEVTLGADDGEGSGVKGVYCTVDGTNWTGYSGPATVSAEGLTKLGFYAEDNAGNKSEVQWLEVKIDDLAPVAGAAESGTKGLGGWYISPVKVALSAQDNTAGSGLADLLYTLDGSNWLACGGAVTIAAEGTTRIGYYCEDVASNVSEAVWLELKLDTRAPQLALVPSITEIWPPSGGTVTVPVEAAGVDATSGMANLHLKVLDEYGLVQPEMDVTTSPVSVPLIADRYNSDTDGRVYTLVLTGTDVAGNKSTVQATVVVPRNNPKNPKDPKPARKATR